MSIPLERTRLPISVKQELADCDELMFPPANFEILLNACRTSGLPESEALLFVSDNAVSGHPEFRGVILDLWGPTMCGKTYFCHALVAQYLDAGHMCVYIDCEGSFSLTRIKALCKNSDSLPLLVYRVLDWTDLMPSLLSIPGACQLLILDSVSFHLRHHKSILLSFMLDKIYELQIPLTVLVNQTTTTLMGETAPSLGKTYQNAITKVGGVSQEIHYSNTVELNRTSIN